MRKERLESYAKDPGRDGACTNDEVVSENPFAL
jgi:hypothetical protein